ncbi:MAG: hypothetical protein KGL39_40785 [Patescibacteria group bacterium]|nr:hypothetical protein [Patescibacteria group bacterium]
MQLCGARTKHGRRCRQAIAPGKRRCKYHGGRMVPWPKGKRRSAADMSRTWEGRARAQARRKAQGLPWYGKRTPGKLEAQAMAEVAKEVIETFLADLPAPGEAAPGAMTLGQLSTEVNRHGLLACLDMVQRYDPDGDIKDRRLIVEITGMVTRANVRLAEGEFRARRDDVIGRLIAELAAERQEAKPAAEAKKKSGRSRSEAGKG